MIHDRLENWTLYFNHPVWRTAFDYLAGLSEESEVLKRVEIQGSDIYASLQSYLTIRPEDAQPEAHNRYIDIQMSLSNCEVIEWFPRKQLQQHTPYSGTDDIEFFHRPGPAPVRIGNCPGFFTVLFSEDAHLPKAMCGSTPDQVKKVVVKVKADLVLPLKPK